MKFFDYIYFNTYIILKFLLTFLIHSFMIDLLLYIHFSLNITLKFYFK